MSKRTRWVVWLAQASRRDKMGVERKQQRKGSGNTSVGFVSPDKAPISLATIGDNAIVINIEQQFRLTIKRQWNTLFFSKVPPKEDISFFAQWLWKGGLCARTGTFHSPVMPPLSNLRQTFRVVMIAGGFRVSNGVGLPLATAVAAIYDGVH